MSVSHLLYQHRGLLIVWAIVAAALSLGASLLFPKQYRAVSQVLVISSDRSGVDPYTQAKSAERIGENLAEVIKTSDFYNKVIGESTMQFDKGRWSAFTSERARRKRWQKDVQTEVVYGTSLLRLSVYGPTRVEAEALAAAVTQTLVGRGWEYTGGGVTLKEVDKPLSGRLPARPDFVLNAALGALFGLIASAAWIIRYKKHLLFGN